jgi:hypothetical protein
MQTFEEDSEETPLINEAKSYDLDLQIQATIGTIGK